MKNKTAIVALTALIVAYISAKCMPQGTPLVTIPWGVIALVIGLYAQNKKQALLLGGLLGFVASYSYLWFDNTSGKSFLLAAVILLPATFGLLCGLGASWASWSIRWRTKR